MTGKEHRLSEGKLQDFLGFAEKVKNRW